MFISLAKEALVRKSQDHRMFADAEVEDDFFLPVMLPGWVSSLRGQSSVSSQCSRISTP